MSRQIQRPGNLVTQTNVAYVRYKYKNKRFEIACYPNKVLDWRRGVEKDLSEVLQSERVYTNASRGIEASVKQLKQAFQTDDHAIAIEHILKKGVLQVSKRERQAGLKKAKKEVASIITSKCINKETQRPFPQTVIEKAMENIGFSVNPKKSAKAMALALIPQLQEELPIVKAQMRLRLLFPGNTGKAAKSDVLRIVTKIEKEKFAGNCFIYEVLVDPGDFRGVDELVGRFTRGKGSVEILETCVAKTSVEFFGH